jgi:DGQHR domain-containing protein
MTIKTLDLNIQVPCIQGFFGSRLATYTTQIKPLQLKRLLGHDPRSKYWKMLPADIRELYEQVQRPTSANRRAGVAGYIEGRLTGAQVGAFPAVSLGITAPAPFRAYDGAPEGVGELEVDEESLKIILDGLGRVSGALDLADESAEGKAKVGQFTFPLTIFAPMPGTGPLSVKELGQLFADFNFRVNPVPARIAINLDQYDDYINLTNALAKEPAIADFGGMEVKAASLGKKSSAIVVQTVLLRVVRGATEGRDFQESNLARAEEPNLTEDTFEAELASISGFFSEIQQRMGDRWKDRTALHLTAPGWQALGVLHHDMHHRGLNLSAAQKSAIYDVLGAIDWSRSNEEWATEAGLGTFEDGELVIRGAGRSNTQAILTYLRVKTGLAPKLDAALPKAA